MFILILIDFQWVTLTLPWTKSVYTDNVCQFINVDCRTMLTTTCPFLLGCNQNIPSSNNTNLILWALIWGFLWLVNLTFSYLNFFPSLNLPFYLRESADPHDLLVSSFPFFECLKWVKMLPLDLTVTESHHSRWKPQDNAFFLTLYFPLTVSCQVPSCQ